MAWSAKLVGGLIGGMVGGPVGAGLGVTLGHVLGDRERALELGGVEWQHHGFSRSGPGLWLNPVWVARGREGADVQVRIDLGDAVRKAVVVPEARVEECRLPRVFIPYDRVADATRVLVSLRSGTERDQAAYDVAMPSPVRRLGNSGPARLVMALVACARAGDRPLRAADRAFIRGSFTEGHPLDADGLAWLEAWLDELAEAELERISPAKVARRAEPHLDAEGRDRLILWLLRGPWHQPEQEDFVDLLGHALGADVEALRRRIEEGPDPYEVLGLASGATVDEARRAYRQLAHQWHPDRAPPGEVEAWTRRMAELNAAWRKIAG